ncbi:hypothetical protein BLS_009961 [Venturia inaequalis]|uniref:DUF221-domain-containing protein n=1 Tax=Venturia inaequalis TaxID=5025 RepID=A0A8H3YJM3_VENIN|nr:hypothetical protein BLS_009961 [Venturia inaequalis]
MSTDQSKDPNIGSAKDGPTSASALITTLVPVLVVAIVWFVVFVAIRSRAAWKYAPRTRSKTLRKDNYSPELPNTLFGWLPKLWAIPDSYVLTHQGLDAYLFLRFLKMAVISCVVGAVICVPVLIPVNATGGGNGQQLDKISMTNVGKLPIQAWRFFAHAACAWLFFGYLLVMITRESIFFINLRQAYLMSPLYANKLSSRTVLFTSVPNAYLNEEKMREMLGPGVRRVWLPTDTKDLDELVDERQKVAMKLEGAETKLVKLANKARLKSLSKGADSHEESNVGLENGAESNGSVAARWLAVKDRPTHKLKLLIGKKVDTISWSREELERLQPKIEEEQAKHRAGDAVKIRAVFVEFENLREAQAAYQSLTHHEVATMAPRYTGMIPSDIIWKNLRIKGWERMVRTAVTIGIVCATILFWSIPVALVASFSNINRLIEIKGLQWLSFINNLPSVLLGLITGLLPVVLLALLMSLLPPYLRWMARLGGAPTHSDAEFTCQNYYFGFQIVQVFLVATLGSAAPTIAQSVIANPSTIATTLSSAIPTSANFFLSYFILQGLGVVSGILVGIAGLFITPLLVMILGSTPRKIFLKWNGMSSIGWGVVYPLYTNLFIIAICYACIAPLVLVFAAIGLFFFYFAYRYNFLYVYKTTVDTRGAVYARALQHLFVGLYIAELCLIGLFGTRLQQVGAIGPFIMMIILIVFTALYHIALNAALGPLLRYLPKSLEAEERRSLLDHEAEHEDFKNAQDPSLPREKGDNKLDQPTHVAEDAPPHKKPNFITKFLHPGVYNDYRTMRRLIPNFVTEEHDGVANEDEIAMDRDAYLPPSVWADIPQLIIPRDDGGVSAQEVRDSSKVIPITDQGAYFNEKNKIIVDDDFMSAVYFEDKALRMKEKH